VALLQPPEAHHAINRADEDLSQPSASHCLLLASTWPSSLCGPQRRTTRGKKRTRRLPPSRSRQTRTTCCRSRLASPSYAGCGPAPTGDQRGRATGCVPCRHQPRRPAASRGRELRATHAATHASQRRIRSSCGGGCGRFSYGPCRVLLPPRTRARSRHIRQHGCAARTSGPVRNIHQNLVELAELPRSKTSRRGVKKCWQLASRSSQHADTGAGAVRHRHGT
jgi:hypothetical protein